MPLLYTGYAMPVIKITKSTVDAIQLPASGQVIYKDSQLKGFGLKVGTTSKTYIAEGTPNGRTRLVTIGRHGVITTEQARKKAQAILQDMREGVDPNMVKKQARAKQLTLAEAADLYINGTKVRAARTTQTYRYALDYYLSDWLKRPLGEITRKDCYDRHQRIGREHGHYVANNAMAVLRGIYNRALKQFEEPRAQRRRDHGLCRLWRAPAAGAAEGHGLHQWVDVAGREGGGKRSGDRTCARWKCDLEQGRYLGGGGWSGGCIVGRLALPRSASAGKGDGLIIIFH